MNATLGFLIVLGCLVVSVLLGKSLRRSFLETSKNLTSDTRQGATAVVEAAVSAARSCKASRRDQALRGNKRRLRRRPR